MCAPASRLAFAALGGASGDHATESPGCRSHVAFVQEAYAPTAKSSPNFCACARARRPVSSACVRWSNQRGSQQL
ncbi:hypothetical protein PAL_GLEAN10000001 [Pteropus alecto]|uniref:Uncharacterized protein n=1 Tax=Pteropus alecto TaxID=9402 RepID=L5JTB8_PTEAL|nr:hypothetical protein PAL_GLEAN10000001 [Pteropus alecto]